MRIRGFRFAANCLNDRNRLCDAAGIARRRSSFPRCERTQRENRIHTMGSKPPFAFAETLDDAPAAKPTLVFRL